LAEDISARNYHLWSSNSNRRRVIIVEYSRARKTLKDLENKNPVALFAGPLAKLAASKLKLADRKFATIEDSVELASSWDFFPFHLNDYFTIKPLQVREEITDLLALVRKVHPKKMLEIGTALGGTLYLFAKVADSDAVIVTIDLPSGAFGGGYPIWKIPLYRSFAKRQQKIVLIRGDSHSSDSLRQLKNILDHGELDFLFIDGDHRYEGVRRDYEMYGQLIRRGGLIAFHDIVPHSVGSQCEVSRFWNEVKYSYKHAEIVKDRSQKSGGIGVLFVE
jgi:predicted O-methyltransferase YrrM